MRGFFGWARELGNLKIRCLNVTVVTYQKKKIVFRTSKGTKLILNKLEVEIKGKTTCLETHTKSQGRTSIQHRHHEKKL